jgi:hypothetical protein
MLMCSIRSKPASWLSVLKAGGGCSERLQICTHICRCKMAPPADRSCCDALRYSHNCSYGEESSSLRCHVRA